VNISVSALSKISFCVNLLLSDELIKMSKKLFPILYRKKDSELVNFFITINFIYIYIFFYVDDL